MSTKKGGHMFARPIKALYYKTYALIPCAYAYNVKLAHSELITLRRAYIGKDSSMNFVNILISDIQAIYIKYFANVEPINQLTPNEITHFTARTYHICKKAFTEGEKCLRDHDHISVLYRSLVHNYGYFKYQLAI